MAKMIQVPYDYSIVVPSTTAQAVQEKNNGTPNENPISLEALGLLVNLLSYPSTWELHKTELYKRFGKNKETSVKSAWTGLMEANYIIEFKYRAGRKWEFVYYFRKVPFTSEEKAEILADAEKEYGEIWGLDFQDLKMETSKPRGNQKNILKKDPIQNTNKNNIDKIDDDKRTSPSGEGSAIHSDESIDLIINNFREETKDELSNRSFNTIVRKVVNKYNQGTVNSFRDYLATALYKKINELELRREKKTVKQQSNHTQLKQVESKLKDLEIKDVSFYNWLES